MIYKEMPAQERMDVSISESPTEKADRGRNKGNILVVLLVILGIAVLGGVGFYVIKTGHKETQTISQATLLPEPSSTSPSSPSSTAIATTSQVVSAHSSDPATISNCGTVSDDNVASYIMEGSGLSSQDKTSLQCMANALGNCKSASVTVARTNQTTKNEVVGIQSQMCATREYDFGSTKPTVCKIPLSIINQYYQLAKSEQKLEEFYITFAISATNGDSEGGFTDQITGEKVRFQCSRSAQ
jgi:flagellar basal body-associated protein FliL